MILEDSLGIQYVKIKLNAYFLVFIKNKFGNKLQIYMLLIILVKLLMLLISLNHAMKIAIYWFKLELKLLVEINRNNFRFLRNLWKVLKILFIIKKGSGSDNNNNNNNNNNNDPKKKKNKTWMISIIFILKF